MTEDRGAAYRFRVFRVFRGSNLCALCVLCGYHLHGYPALSPLSVYSVYFVVHLLPYLKVNHGIHKKILAYTERSDTFTMLFCLDT